MRIVFLGDSITEGCFELYNENGKFDTVRDFSEVYHSKLKKYLKDVDIINAGISGNSAKMGLERLETDVVAKNPDVVVVCFGLNDVLGGLDNLQVYKDSLGKIFEKLKSCTHKIIFMTPNSLNTYVHPNTLESATEIAELTAKLQNDGTMDIYMDEAKKICVSNDVAVCDIYSEWKNYIKYGVDVTMLLSNYINHPTRKMHGLFSDMLLQYLL